MRIRWNTANYQAALWRHQWLHWQGWFLGSPCMEECLSALSCLPTQSLSGWRELALLSALPPWSWVPDMWGYWNWTWRTGNLGWLWFLFPLVHRQMEEPSGDRFTLETGLQAPLVLQQDPCSVGNMERLQKLSHQAWGSDWRSWEGSPGILLSLAPWVRGYHLENEGTGGCSQGASRLGDGCRQGQVPRVTT